MNLKPDRLLKSKTFWTGVGAVVSAGATYATGETTAAEALQLGFTGALGIFLRMALTKGINMGVKF
jgi:hypothetical protein